MYVKTINIRTFYKIEQVYRHCFSIVLNLLEVLDSGWGMEWTAERR